MAAVRRIIKKIEDIECLATFKRVKRPGKSDIEDLEEEEVYNRHIFHPHTIITASKHSPIGHM